jgi:hypothetical protein
MRQIAIVLSAAILAACAKKEGSPAADSTRAGNNPQPASPMNLADVAGKWQVQVVGETSDSVLLTYEMTATADTTGWTITLPNRDPMPLRVMSVAGDSAVLENGPYESVLRPGVQVSTVSVVRLRGDRLMGKTVAHYVTSGADSLVHLRTRGRRAP